MADTTFTFKFNANTSGVASGFNKMAEDARKAASRIAASMDSVSASIKGYDKLIENQKKILGNIFDAKNLETKPIETSIDRIYSKLDAVAKKREQLNLELQKYEAEYDKLLFKSSDMTDEATKMGAVLERQSVFGAVDSADLEKFKELLMSIDEIDSKMAGLQNKMIGVQEAIKGNEEEQKIYNNMLSEQQTKLDTVTESHQASIDNAIHGLDELQEEQTNEIKKLGELQNAEEEALTTERIAKAKAAWASLGAVLKNLASTIGKLSVNVLKGTFSTIKKVMNPLGNLSTLAKLFLGGAAFKLGKDATEAASELKSSMDVVNEAYGSNASAMHDWAENQARYYGLARTEAEKYFSAVGEYLSNIGIDTGSSSTMAMNMAAKAGEIASVYGGTNDKVFENIRKAIEKEGPGGNTSLSAYGVVMNKAAYNTELLREGISATYDELSSSEKLIVRYNTAMEQLGAVSGATAGEFTTWEGALAGITNNAKDALASFGAILQNYLLPLVQVLARIMQSLSFSLSNLLQTLGVETATASIEDYSDAIADLGTSTEDASEKASKASKGLASFDKINNLTSGSGSGEIAGMSKRIKATNKLSDASKKGVKPIQELLSEFMNADWKAAGKKVGGWVNGIITNFGLLADWLKTGKLGKNLGDFLNGLTESQVWGNTSKTLVSLLTGILTTIGEMFSVTDMMAIGSQIVTGLIDGIEENKDQIITELSNILDGISDFIIGFFDPKNMGKLGSQLGDIVNGVAKNGSISKVAQALTTMLMGIFNFILEFVKTVNWLEVATEILKGIGTAIMENPSIVIEGLGAWFVWNSVKHLFTGLTGIGQGIANGIAAPIKSAGLKGGVVELAVAGLVVAIGTAISSLNDYIESINNLYESAEKSYALLNKTDYGAVEQVAEDAQTDLFARANKAKEAEKIYESAVTEWNSLAATVSERGFITNSDADAINSITADLNEFAKIAKELGMKDSGYLNEMVENLNAITELDLESGFWGSNLTDMQNGFANVQTAVSNAWGVTQEYNASLDEAMKRLSEKTVKDKENIDELNKSMEKMQNDELVKYIDKFSKEELKAFNDAIDTSKDHLQGFLDKVTELTNLKWNGDIVDINGLSSNLDTAISLVQSAAKTMNEAIAGATDLKNFEATLSSTQTIKVESNGTMDFKFDITTKPDRDAFNTWMEKYNTSKQYSTGTKTS